MFFIVFLSLGLTASESAITAAIQNQQLVFIKEEIDDIIKIVKFIEDATLWTEGNSKRGENKFKE